MTDEVISSFEKRRDAGELFSNPASFTRVKYFAKEMCGCIYRTERPKGNVISYTTSANLQSGHWRASTYQWSTDALETSHKTFINTKRKASALDIDVAMTSISSEMASGMASILVTLAERDKTRAMFMKAFDYLRKPLKDVLKECKKMTGPERVAKLESWWLEGRYGWRPFVYDVISIIEAQNAEARYRLTKKDLVSENETIVDAAYAHYGIATACTNVRVEQRIAQWVSFGQTGDFRSGLMAPFRKFGWYDLVGAGWDLVPYSFVIDWFINVGEAAKAMEAFLLYEERIGWVRYNEITTNRLYHVTTWEPYNPSGGTTWYYVDSIVGPLSRVTAESETWTRVPYANFAPHFGLRCDLDWKKVVDIAFLTHGLWRRVKGG